MKTPTQKKTLNLTAPTGPATYVPIATFPTGKRPNWAEINNVNGSNSNQGATRDNTLSPRPVEDGIFAEDEITALTRQEQRSKQIDALAMRLPQKAKSKDGWAKIAGKYPEGSPRDRIMEAGAKIREAERPERC